MSSQISQSHSLMKYFATSSVLTLMLKRLLGKDGVLMNRGVETAGKVFMQLFTWILRKLLKKRKQDT